MADYDYWASGTGRKRKLGENDDWLKEKIKQASDPDSARKQDFLNQWTAGNENSAISHEVKERINTRLDSIKDQSHREVSSFRWTCIARHPDAMMFSDQKRCRYCKSTEEHEDDHPLYWKEDRSEPK